MVKHYQPVVISIVLANSPMEKDNFKERSIENLDTSSFFAIFAPIFTQQTKES